MGKVMLRLMRHETTSGLDSKTKENRDKSEGTDKNGNFVGTALVDLGVLEDLLEGLEHVSEQVTTQLLETGTGKGEHKLIHS
jgi:hypothetical protein